MGQEVVLHCDATRGLRQVGAQCPSSRGCVGHVSRKEAFCYSFAEHDDRVDVRSVRRWACKVSDFDFT